MSQRFAPLSASTRARGLTILIALLAASAAACIRPPSTQPTEPQIHVEPDPEEVVVEPVLPPPPPAPLTRFLGLLDGLETGNTHRPINIVILGDSHTASDTWTATFRRNIVARFGGSGRGYAYPGSPWRHFRQLDMGYSQSSGWQTHHVLRSEFEGAVGFGGLRLSSDPEEEASLSRSRCNNCNDEYFEVYFVRQPEGGSFTLTLMAELAEEEEPPAPDLVVDTQSSGEDDYSLARVMLPIEGDRPARLELRTRGDGPVDIIGMSSAADVPGVRVESFGLNGAQLRHFLKPQEDHFSADLAARQPDLVVLAFGSNEAFSPSYGPNSRVSSDCDDMDSLSDAPECEPRPLEAHPLLAQHAQALLERVRAAAPEADCLFVLPPDLIPTRDEPECYEVDVPGIDEPVCIADPPWRFQIVQQTLAEVAEEAGCQYWDAQAAMGGPGSMRVWMAKEPALGAPDGVHLSFPGYALIGDGMFYDLMEALEAFRDGDTPQITTRPLTPEHELDRAYESAR